MLNRQTKNLKKFYTCQSIFLSAWETEMDILKCFWGKPGPFDPPSPAQQLLTHCWTSCKTIFASAAVRFPGCQNVINKRIKNACKWATEQDVARTWTWTWASGPESQPENQKPWVGATGTRAAQAIGMKTN